MIKSNYLLIFFFLLCRGYRCNNIRTITHTRLMPNMQKYAHQPQEPIYMSQNKPPEKKKALPVAFWREKSKKHVLAAPNMQSLNIKDPLRLALQLHACGQPFRPFSHLSTHPSITSQNHHVQTVTHHHHRHPPPLYTTPHP